MPRQQILSLPTIISEHYNGEELATAIMLERFYFARYWGKVRSERWDNRGSPRVGLAQECPTIPTWGSAVAIRRGEHHRLQKLNQYHYSGRAISRTFGGCARPVFSRSQIQLGVAVPLRVPRTQPQIIGSVGQTLYRAEVIG
jgi:hypothetical protein